MKILAEIEKELSRISTFFFYLDKSTLQIKLNREFDSASALVVKELIEIYSILENLDIQYNIEKDYLIQLKINS